MLPPIPPNIPLKIFISYSHADIATAQYINRTLMANGHTVWMDTPSLNGGDVWRNTIDSALKSSEIVVVLVTPSSITSPEVEREWKIAASSPFPYTYTLYPDAYVASIPIIPILFSPSIKIPKPLMKYQYILIQNNDLSPLLSSLYSTGLKLRGYTTGW